MYRSPKATNIGEQLCVTANVKMTHYRQLKIDPPEAK